MSVASLGQRKERESLTKVRKASKQASKQASQECFSVSYSQVKSFHSACLSD